MSDITPQEELLVAHALVSELIRERTQLVEKLKIAMGQLQAFSDQKRERYPGEMGTFAHDALIQISVVE